MPLNCKELKKIYKTLKTKKDDFAISLEKTPADISHLNKLKKELEQEFSNFYELPFIIRVSAFTPEGKLVNFNLNKQLKNWKEFYDMEGVDWAELPGRISITKNQAKEMKRLIEELGFDKMLIIPDGLADTGKKKYEELFMKMTEGYSKKEIKTDAERREEMEKCMSVNFKKDGGLQGMQNKSNKLRIILTKEAKEIADYELLKQTLNKSTDELEEGIFKEKNARGLDMASYLVLQREYFKRTGEHMDSDYYTWLTEMRRPVSGRVPFVDWNAVNDRLTVNSDTSGHRFGGVGCRLAGSFDVV